MNNAAYLDKIGVTKPAKRAKCLEVMARYGADHWWELPDAETRILRQLGEPVWLLEGGFTYRLSQELILMPDGPERDGAIQRWLISEYTAWCSAHEPLRKERAIP